MNTILPEAKTNIGQYFLSLHIDRLDMAREICSAGIVAVEGNNGRRSAMLASREWDVSLRVSVMFINFSPGSSICKLFTAVQNFCTGKKLAEVQCTEHAGLSES